MPTASWELPTTLLKNPLLFPRHGEAKQSHQPAKRPIPSTPPVNISPVNKTAVGIKDNATFEAACAHANGTIIGSVFIQAIGKAAHVQEATAAFLGEVLGAIPVEQ